MAKETIGFWDSLHSLLVNDDQARWRTITWAIIIGGTAGSIDLAVLNSSVDDAVFASGAAALISLIVCVGWYCALGSMKEMAIVPIIPRRTILQAATSGIGIFIVSFLSRLEAQALESQVEGAIRVLDSPQLQSTPTGVAIIARANDAMRRANSLAIRLRAASDYGERAIAGPISEEVTDVAWQGTQLALAQRTFTNSDFEPPLPITHQADWVAAFDSPGPVKGRMTWRGDWVEKGAEIHRLNVPDPNTGTPVPQYLLIENAVADLSDYVIRDVVYRDSQIIYRGGSLDMSGTYFVRCTFDISPTSDGHRFAQAVMAAVPAMVKTT